MINQSQQPLIDRAISINEKMARLNKALHRYTEIAADESRATWGHVGDLAHVEAQLDEILRFVGG